MRKVAVEKGLTPVGDFLQGRGYKVDTFGFGDLSAENKVTGYDAIVVSGIDKNIFGLNDTNTKAVVITAKGLTPEQVYHELQMRFES